MTYEMIRAERTGDVLVITLNRPDRLNAAPPELFDEISAALDNLGGARAVLITGEGRAFCSGADLAGRDSAGGSISGGQRAHRALTKSYNPLMMKLARLPVPLGSSGPGSVGAVFGFGFD